MASRAWVGIILLSVTLMVGGALFGPSRFWNVITRRFYVDDLIPEFADGNRTRGWVSERRWGTPSLHGRSICFYVDNGYKAMESDFRTGRMLRLTIWDVGGKVIRQVLPGPDRTAPPWEGGVRDQVGPSAPAWILDEMRWQRVRDAAR